ncbi:MAG: hypothetical protein EBZ48_03395 [Proteobacteria bacterium]|nr:hypothetical protein [Pseudomonadota bacterium]
MTVANDSPPIILAVDADLGRAQRLMDALQSFRREARVTVIDTLDQAHRNLFDAEYSVVVLTPEHSEDILKSFIDSGRKTYGGQDAAYVLLVEQEEQNEDILALGMLAGVNGFLFSPFSAEGVNNTFLIAKKLKTDRIERSQKDEIAIALRAAKKQLDLISAALQDSEDVAIDPHKLEYLQRAIKACADKNADLFYRMLVGSFIWETKEPPTTGAINYRGGSERVRKLLAERAKRALAAGSKPSRIK